MTQNPKMGTILCFCVALAAVFLPAGGAEARLWDYRSATDPTSFEDPLGEPRNHLPPDWIMRRPDPLGQMGTATRDPSISVDPTIGRVRETYTEGGVETQPPMVADLDQYSNVLTTRTYRRLWRGRSRESRSVTRGTLKRQRGPLSIDIPIKFPKVFRGLLGDGTPNIDVSGSETITLSGVSDWTVRPEGTFDTERQRQSAFPSLEMKQDLQVNLTGSIGDKIKVDVDQSSNVTTSVDNKVKLRYEGDEDDMIKSIDLGNTNLSLQGASIRQEGLFGVKTVAKLGNVDVVAIASKQEGKTESSRFTPSGEKRRVTIRDLEYIKRQYFFISSRPILWDRASLVVFKDDLIGSNNAINMPDAMVRLDPTVDSTGTPQLHGTFVALTQGVDYDVIFPYQNLGSSGEEWPVIRMKYPLNPQEMLAVTYVERGPSGDIKVGDPNPDNVDPVLQKPANTYLLKMIKPGFEEVGSVPGGAYDTTDPWYPALAYELRNHYDLTARNIAPETVTLKVRKLDANQSVDPDAIGETALAVITGLDQEGATVDDPPDGRVDAKFLDPETGIVFFPDLHPFAPGCDGTFYCQDDTTRNILKGDLANPHVYYTKVPDLTSQTRYYIDAEFKSSQSGYFLGRFNIHENSEQVKVDNILMKKGSDYILDYETGQLTFTRPPGPEAVITVDYSFAPGVAQVQRTLMGFSTSYSPSADFSVTSSMLYESRGAQELNPKLGEEPARSMVGDLASVMTFRPSWMTGFANILPGVHTSAPSTLNLQGNLAVSMPNPNTKGEAYVEDMEGNRESNLVALSRATWLWSSIPVDPVTLQPITTDPTQHARIEWYNPTSARGGAKERDLKPILTQEEGADNERTVLELNVLAHDTTGVFSPTTWAGITQPLSRTGQDLSRTRFVEIWVNDRRPLAHDQTQATLHIDFGRVSEDAFWEQNAPPNTLLDSEDKNCDTKLDFDEDTGLDGIPNELEPGSTGDPDVDVSGDDFRYINTGEEATDYSKINGTEKNQISNPRPDTEDLDLNCRLDLTDSYFEATIDLSDTAYVAVDVARDYAGHPVVQADNGWRLFRIPLDSPAFRPHGGPSWDDIKHARIWIDDMAGPTNIQIGGIELVGSRWLATPLSDSLKARNVIFDVKVRNNKDDAAIYTSPFEVPNAVGGSATRREQSLALAYDRLESGDSVYAFRTYADNGSGIGYTQYREIRFYVHGDPGVELQNLRMLARFGPDTVNYYEYSLPVRTGWQDVRIPMEVLSRLKEASNDRVKVDSLTGADIGARYTVVGNPTFTRVNRITFGLTVFGAAPTGPPGEVWIDELRLDGVRKESGKTGNVAIQANFADVLAVNGSYQKQDQDFFRVGSGVNQGTGLNHTAIGFSSTLQLDKMLPLTGLQLPVRLTVAHASDVPKYRTGSDVVLDDARSAVETRRSDRQAIDFSYRRTGPRKGWTRWTIDAISGSLAYTRQSNIDPQSTDSSWAFSTSGTYDLPIGGGKAIPLSKTLRFKYLPDIITFGMDWSAAHSTAYSRFIQGTEDSLALRSNVQSRLLTLRTGLTYLPINGVTTKYSLSSRRDMLLRREGFLFGSNIGTEVDHTQTMELNWVPRRVLFLNPNVTLLGSYREFGGAGVRLEASDPLELKNISNRGTARVNNTIPLSRFAQRFRSPGSARGDTSGTSPLLAPLRYVLGRMQDIQTNFSFERSASASRVVGKPGFAYVTGFTQKLDPTLYRAPNSNIVQSRSYVSTASTSFQPVTNVTLDVRADHRLSFNDAFLGARKVYTLSWPDLNARWMQLQQALGLEDMMSSLIVSSHYSLKTEDQGPQGKPIETSVKTTNWGPLLRWEASFKNGIRANVNTAIAKSEALDQRLGGLVRIRTSTNHDIRFDKTYPASKGIRFPWSKRRVKLPNDVNLNLTCGIARDKQETERLGFETLVETDVQRLNVGSGTTYNFTPSITGGFDLAFRQTKDYKSALTQRGITISVTGQFRF